MAKKRIKVEVPALSADDLIRITGEIAEASHDLAVDTERMNKRVDEVKAKHEEAQATLANEIKIKTDLLERWASANPDRFAERKSLEFPRAIIGFRLGTPRVKTLKGISEEEALKALAALEDGERFIRRPEPELNKPAIIAARTSAESLADLKSCGLEVAQKTSFFVEPKSESSMEAVS